MSSGDESNDGQARVLDDFRRAKDTIKGLFVCECLIFFKKKWCEGGFVLVFLVIK